MKIRSLIKKFFESSKSAIEETWVIEKSIILPLLPPNPIIIDCGAHIGTDAVEFAKIEGSIIYVFEQIKEIYNQLVENTKSFKNIHSFNIALSDFDGNAEMYVSSGYSDGSSSLLKPKKHLEDHPDVFFDNKELVKCRTLDSWANENGVTKVDMLWLDMQGAEQQMLAASEKILGTASLIHTEVSKHESYEGAGLYHTLKSFLFSKNFKVFVEAVPSWNYGGNVLFQKIEIE